MIYRDVIVASTMTATSSLAVGPGDLVRVLLDRIEDHFGARPLGTFAQVARVDGKLTARWQPPRAPRATARWDIEEEVWK